MKIFDLFLYNGEEQILQERLDALESYVDVFCILEFGVSFSGVEKPQLFSYDLIPRKVKGKVKYQFIKDLSVPTSEAVWRTKFGRSLAWKHGGKVADSLSSSLKREISQRDTLYRLVEDIITGDDIVIVSDADEIPSPDFFDSLSSLKTSDIAYAEMDWRLYYTDVKCALPWYGTYAVKGAVLQHYSVDELRVASCNMPRAIGDLQIKIIPTAGVHLSYLGGVSEIRKKLKYHPYQGLRAEASKLLVLGFPGISAKLLSRGFDILFQGRDLLPVGLDSTSLSHLSMGFREAFSHDNIL